MKKQSLLSLNNQAQKLNSTLETSVETITSIQKYGQYILDNGSEFNLAMPTLKQDGKDFFLDIPEHNAFDVNHEMHGNITGIGDISSFSPEKQQEIAMANLLLPSFITGKNVLKEANWFFYASLQEFVNIYPWINRKSWHYTERFLSKYRHNIMDKLIYSPIKSTHTDIVWSPPYVDAAGTGMNTSLGLGLYRENKLLGAVMIDIDLSSLHNLLPDLSNKQQGVVVYNKKGKILLFKQLGEDALTENTTWKQIRPENFPALEPNFLSTLDKSSQHNGWLIEQDDIPINGWKIARFQSYDEFSSPLKYQVIFLFALLLFGFLAFLLLVNSLTRRSFIQPTQNFIEHIEHCAKGDPGKIKPSSDWLPWFYLVEDIFIENRSFFQQLKDQNRVLDSRVNEKTQALRESSEKHQRNYIQLRSVMNAIPELIIFNDPDGHLMGCNQEFELLTKHSESSMLGKNAHHFMPTALAKELGELNAFYNDHYPQQSLIHAGDFIYQGYCNQFKNAQGEILGTIVILQDVTKQQEIKEALELAKDTAENANKVKIQFLANMSHEIRTPINAMQGMMELLGKSLDNSRQQHYLVNAQTASVSLLHLVDELLDLSKIEAGKMVLYKSPVNLTELIDKAVKLNIGVLQQKQLQLIIQISADTPHYIDCDEMRLVQVISNLLNNAVKFTEKGEIKLAVNVISIHQSEVTLSISVTDSGIGIDSSKQANLFKAFSQADESMTRLYGGSGLGLSICQQIVKLYGSEITINSQLGEGSQFSFSISFALCPDEEASFKNDIVQKMPNLNAAFPKETVTLYVINQELSNNFVENVQTMGWLIIKCENLTEFINIDKHNKVLIADALVLEKKIGVHVQENKHNKLNDDLWHKKVALVALCQKAMSPVKADIFDYLSINNLPSMLLELPLYRYALLEINRALHRTSKNKAMRGAYSEQMLLEGSIASNENINNHYSHTDNTNNFDEDHNDVNTEKPLCGIHVLLVEDNLVNQLVEEELLNELGAKVTLAENGAQAVELITNESFDVVLMDIQMPVMDGLTAAKVIRKQPEHKLLPIIAMTAHARYEDEKQSLEAGMNIHIAKPVTSDLLCSSILEVIAKA